MLKIKLKEAVVLGTGVGAVCLLAAAAAIVYTALDAGVRKPAEVLVSGCGTHDREVVRGWSVQPSKTVSGCRTPSVDLTVQIKSVLLLTLANSPITYDPPMLLLVFLECACMQRVHDRHCPLEVRVRVRTLPHVQSNSTHVHTHTTP